MKHRIPKNGETMANLPGHPVLTNGETLDQVAKEFFKKGYTLRKKVSILGVILVCIFPTFSRIPTEYGEVSSAGKMRTRITLNTDTFCGVTLTLKY